MITIKFYYVPLWVISSFVSHFALEEKIEKRKVAVK